MLLQTEAHGTECPYHQQQQQLDLPSYWNVIYFYPFQFKRFTLPRRIWIEFSCGEMQWKLGIDDDYTAKTYLVSRQHPLGERSQESASDELKRPRRRRGLLAGGEE